MPAHLPSPSGPSPRAAPHPGVFALAAIILGAAATGAQENAERFVAEPLVAQASELAEHAWVEVRGPDVVVYADTDEATARAIVGEFADVRVGLRRAVPGARVRAGSPVRVVAVRDIQALATAAPDVARDWGQEALGLYVRGWERQYALLRADVSGVMVADQASPHQEVLRQYAAALLDLNYGRLPLWLSEGMSDLLSTAQTHDDTVTVGRYIDPYLRRLRVLGAPSLRSTLAQESWKVPDVIDSQSFKAHAWVIAHDLLYGGRSERRAQLDEFIRLYQDGGTPLDAARQAFGDLSALEQEVTAHFSGDSFPFARFPREEQAASVLQVRALTPADVSALLGDFQLARGRLAGARTLLLDALERSPDLAGAHESLGVLEWRERHSGQARAELARATELAPDSPSALYFHAYAVLSQSRLTVAEQNRARRMLQHATEVDDEFASAHTLLAKVLSTSGTLKDALGHARRALELEPGAPSRWLELAQLLSRSGPRDEAVAAARRALAAAHTDADREAARQLLAGLGATD